MKFKLTFLQMAHQHVPVPEGTDSECDLDVLSFLKGDPGRAGIVSRAPAWALLRLRSSVAKLDLEEEAGLHA